MNWVMMIVALLGSIICILNAIRSKQVGWVCAALFALALFFNHLSNLSKS